MKPSRTYSGTRIRLSDHQAHLIIKLINDQLDTTASGELTDTRYPLKDARAKLLPAANRHRTTNAPGPNPGINDVGHTDAGVGHNAGMNTNVG